MAALKHRFVHTNGVRLHVVEAGPADGPLVILLHGFPEYWYGWRRQIEPLAKAGFRVWAPDQRGYNLSQKPAYVADYALAKLTADVVGLMDAAGVGQANVVGHDWGAIVAWWLALTRPDRVRRLVVMNVPHPDVMRHYVLRWPRQLLKSWYVFFFQLPRLPEWLARRGNWRWLSNAMTRTSQPGTFSDADMREYRRAWSEPGAFRAMVNWYRGGLPLRRRPSAGRVRVPTLLLWGVHDAFLERGLAQPSIDQCDNGRLEFFEKATHWLHHEEPAQVNAWLLDFLRDT